LTKEENRELTLVNHWRNSIFTQKSFGAKVKAKELICTSNKL